MEKIIAEKMRAGLTRAQAEEVAKAQAAHDAASNAASDGENIETPNTADTAKPKGKKAK